MEERYGLPPLPPAKKEKYTRLMFNARFVAGERREGPYTVLIDYKTLEPSAIAGYVIGNNRTASRLLFPEHSAALESVPNPHQPDRIECPRTNFRALYRSDFKGDEDGLSAMAGYFVARTLDIHREFPSSAETATVTFSLAGPKYAWMVWNSDPFDAESQYENAEITGISDSFSIRLEPLTLGWSGEHGSVSHRITGLKLSLPPDSEPPTDTGQWLTSATELADDLLVLISLLSDAWVEWFERHFIQAAESSTRRRGPARWTRRGEVFDNHLPVDDPREFLTVAFPALRSWRDAGFDLARPIEYLINASEHAEGSEIQKFASAYLALENLLAVFLEKEKRDFSLKEETFRKELEPKLKMCIKSVIPDREMAEIRRLLYEKLRDVNRPAFSSNLDDCLKAYRVEWRDLYPVGHTLRKPEFIEIRNELFHTGSKTSASRIFLETLRVRSLAYRLLLRFLGWTKRVEWPPDYRESYIRNLWGDEERFARGF